MIWVGSHAAPFNGSTVEDHDMHCFINIPANFALLNVIGQSLLHISTFYPSIQYQLKMTL